MSSCLLLQQSLAGHVHLGLVVIYKVQRSVILAVRRLPINALHIKLSAHQNNHNKTYHDNILHNEKLIEKMT